MRSSAYLPLLRHAAVRRQALTGLISQVTQGAGGVGLVLVVREGTGSTALAGVVVGALSLAAGLARPVQGRLIDARGPTGVMVICGIVHPAALIAIAALATVEGINWLLVALGIVAGIALPPISTSMRAEWGSIAGEERTAAYSLVYLVQELSILAGPLILAAVIAASSARAAVITVAALAGIGTLGFAASIGRDAESHLTTQGSHHRTPHVLTQPPVRMVLLIALLLGGVIGAIEVAVPIFSTGHNAPAASGLLIAAVSLGGIAGGAIYGSGQWRAPARQRLVVLLALMTVWLAILVPADTLALAGVLLLLVGIPLNPALATFSLLIDRHVPEGTAAEAFGWLSTAIAGGTGAASAIAAAVAQRHDSEAAFVVAAVAALSATLLAVLGSRTVLRPPDRATLR